MVANKKIGCPLCKLPCISSSHIMYPIPKTIWKEQTSRPLLTALIKVLDHRTQPQDIHIHIHTYIHIYTHTKGRILELQREGERERHIFRIQYCPCAITLFSLTILFYFFYFFTFIFLFESSKTCTKTPLNIQTPKLQLNQFKQYVKQLVCGNLTYAIIRN